MLNSEIILLIAIYTAAPNLGLAHISRQQTLEVFLMNVTYAVYIGQMLAGYAIGWTAPVIPKLQDLEQTPLPDVITDQQTSWIGSVLLIGSIIGPYVTGFLSKVTGRKPSLFLGACVTLLAYLILALANNLAMIFAGRIIVGLGAGIIFVMNLVYIGEIASTHIRGMLLTATGIFYTLGSLTAYSVGPFVSYSVTGYVGVALNLIYICGIFFIPETPLYLVMTGAEEKAKEVLTFLGRPEDIDNIIISLKQGIGTKRNENQWADVFAIKSNRKALFITLVLQILQQLSGITVVVFFTTTVFEAANSSIEPNIATIITGVTQITASSITPFFVERSGRKTLMLYSTAACCLSLGTLGTYFYLDGVDSQLAASVKWLPLASLIVFFVSYDLGFSIIPGTFIGEMFTPNVRSTGSTITITMGWVAGFVVATTFGYILQLGAHFAFWFYAAGCAVAFTFTVIFVPETRGKSLSEIQEMLEQ